MKTLKIMSCAVRYIWRHCYFDLQGNLCIDENNNDYEELASYFNEVADYLKNMNKCKEI